MPLKKRVTETEGGDGSATEPLIPANPAGGTQRTVSIALPTPFRDAAGTGHPEGLVPLKRAGGIFKDKYGRYRTLYDQRARTTVLVCLAGILERCNEQTLPALYKYVGRSFKASPRQLGLITLTGAIVQALFSVCGGLAGHYLNRVYVMAAGCFIWGIMASLFAFCNSVAQGMAIWAFNGVGLALLIPNAQSLIADYFSALSRGKAFGALWLTGALGGMLGALFATNMGHLRPFGIEGWRVAFLAVGAMSLLIGLFNIFAAVDPRYRAEPRYRQMPDVTKEHVSLRQMGRDIASVLSVPTFVIVVAQGIVGSTPWNALVFNTMYLQLLGMTDFQASLISALFLGGTALGALVGGTVGDWAAAKSPKHGRVFAAQFSVGIGVPLAIIIYKGLPIQGIKHLVALYGVVYTIWGILISWSAPACTNPVFAEVVPSQMRSIVYSFDRSFEGAVAACGAPIVGWLAERLGFTPGDSGESSPDKDLERAQALGNAILICTAVPWALCTLLYTGLHVTYPRDRKRAVIHERARSGIMTTGIMTSGNTRSGLLGTSAAFAEEDEDEWAADDDSAEDGQLADVLEGVPVTSVQAAASLAHGMSVEP